jgi:hypothetical protein
MNFLERKKLAKPKMPMPELVPISKYTQGFCPWSLISGSCVWTCVGVAVGCIVFVGKGVLLFVGVPVMSSAEGL